MFIRPALDAKRCLLDIRQRCLLDVFWIQKKDVF